MRPQDQDQVCPQAEDDEENCRHHRRYHRWDHRRYYGRHHGRHHRSHHHRRQWRRCQRWQGCPDQSRRGSCAGTCCPATAGYSASQSMAGRAPLGGLAATAARRGFCRWGWRIAAGRAPRAVLAGSEPCLVFCRREAPSAVWRVQGGVGGTQQVNHKGHGVHS